MQDADFDRFLQEFQRLSAALQGFKQSHIEAKGKADAYFHVLKRFPLADVIAKADHWLNTEAKMPKPAEWAAVMIRKRVDLPVATQAQADAWTRAEAQRWQDSPCTCRECLEADVSDKPRRFVPECTADDQDRKVLIDGKMQTAGHWAHGWELKRGYDARANFWNKCYELDLMTKREVKKADTRPIAERLEALFAKKGPHAETRTD